MKLVVSLIAKQNLMGNNKCEIGKKSRIQKNGAGKFTLDQTLIKLANLDK